MVAEVAPRVEWRTLALDREVGVALVDKCAKAVTPSNSERIRVVNLLILVVFSCANIDIFCNFVI